MALLRRNSARRDSAAAADVRTQREYSIVAAAAESAAGRQNCLQPRVKDGENGGVRKWIICAPLAAGLLAAATLLLAPARASALPRRHPDGKSAPATKDPVDINHASLDELLTIPGMTPSWAGRIVRFRPYRAKNDLLDRGVLPSDVYDHIKAYIVAHRTKPAD